MREGARLHAGVVDQDDAPTVPLVCVRAPPQNQFDSIDLTDNAIVRLDGFSKLPRLKMLLLSNNRIARIARGLEGQCAAEWGGPPAPRRSRRPC